MPVDAESKRSLFGERGSLRQAILLPLACGAIPLLNSILPALFDRGHSIDDLLHGGRVLFPACVAICLMAFFVALRGIKLRVQAGQSPFPLFLGFLGTLVVIVFAIMLVVFGRNYRLAVALNSHGVPVQAHFDREFTESCTKHGCATGLQYSFIPKGGTQVVRGYADEGMVNRRSDNEYSYAISTGTVPILYDPSDPRRSMVNWQDKIQRSASFSSVLQKLELFGGLFLALLAFSAASIWPSLSAMAASRDGG